jgi:hypothetical protein
MPLKYNKLKPTKKGSVAEEFGKAAARHLLMQMDYQKEMNPAYLRHLKKEHMKRKYKLPPDWAKKDARKDAAIKIVIKG